MKKKLFFLFVGLSIITLALYATQRRCVSCNGSGTIEYYRYVNCPLCGGDGLMDDIDSNGNIKKDAKRCTMQGCVRGKIKTPEYKRCGGCNGKGYVGNN